jgi:hypothetical protein
MCHACLGRFEAQYHPLDPLEPLGGLAEAEAPQFGKPELQVLDLPLLHTQIDGMGREEYVMFDQ